MKKSILVCVLLGLAAVLTTACGQAAPAANSSAGAAAGGSVPEPAQRSLPIPTAEAGSSLGVITTSPANSGAGYLGQAESDSDDSGKQEGKISVTGQGQVSAAPDLATLRLGTESIAGTVQASRTASATATQNMIDALLELEIPEDDISTSSIEISTVFDYQAQTVTGYRVNNLLTVRVRDLSTVGTVIDRVTEAGGDLTRLQGVTFAIEDTAVLEEQARAAAVADLTGKAGQLAGLLGVEVGRAISIVERDRGFSPYRGSFAEAAVMSVPDADTPVLVGEVQVTVTLEAVFAIAEPEGS